jgi:hypothetical protein
MSTNRRLPGFARRPMLHVAHKWDNANVNNGVAIDRRFIEESMRADRRSKLLTVFKGERGCDDGNDPPHR